MTNKLEVTVDDELDARYEVLCDTLGEEAVNDLIGNTLASVLQRAYADKDRLAEQAAASRDADDASET